MGSNNVKVTFSWTGPSTRNGSYNYTLTYSGEQIDDYPEQRRRVQPETTVVLDGREMQVSIPITGLPYANYTVDVTAVNIMTGQRGPSISQGNRTIIIGKLGDHWT